MTGRSFKTRNAEGAVYTLVLAGRSGLHAETLVDRFWPDCPANKASGRLRTLLWQIREGLTTAHAWRLIYDQRVVRLDLSHAVIDVAELTTAGRAILRGDTTEDRGVTERLGEPLLTAWQHEDWVVDEATALSILHRRLRIATAAASVDRSFSTKSARQ